MGEKDHIYSLTSVSYTFNFKSLSIKLLMFGVIQ